MFKRVTIERAIKDFKMIIDQISKNSNINIEKINILSEEEEKYILSKKNEIDKLKTIKFDF